MWLAVPACLYLPWVIPGCAGELTDAEKAELLAGGTSTGTMSTDCGIVAMEKSCSSADGVCHGGSPPIVGLDLTAAGIAAANNGDDFVGRPASDGRGRRRSCVQPDVDARRSWASSLSTRTTPRRACSTRRCRPGHRAEPACRFCRVRNNRWWLAPQTKRAS